MLGIVLDRLRGRRLPWSRRAPATPPSAATAPKEREWSGYYDYYLAAAERGSQHPLDFLDLEWTDGRETARRCVLPYVTASSHVLEIACGIGRVSRGVAPHCASLCCTDILDEALATARRTLAEFANVGFRKINGYDLADFGDETFDCVYSFTAFFHFDWELVVAYFAEIARVLRRGGVGIVELKRFSSDDHFDQLAEKVEQTGGLRKYERELDKWRYVSLEMLALVCERNGLEIVDPTIESFTFRKR